MTPVNVALTKAAYHAAMNGAMRLERVTKRTYRVTGFRRVIITEESRRFVFGRSITDSRGAHVIATAREARQLPEPARHTP